MSLSGAVGLLLLAAARAARWRNGESLQVLRAWWANVAEEQRAASQQSTVVQSAKMLRRARSRIDDSHVSMWLSKWRRGVRDDCNQQVRQIAKLEDEVAMLRGAMQVQAGEMSGKENTLADFEARSHSRGEALMKKTAMRIRNKEIHTAVTIWGQHCRSELRAQRLLHRVGARWRAMEVSEAFSSLYHGHSESKEREKASIIFKRVGARFVKKEVTQNLSEWMRNFRSDREGMCHNRVAWLEAELAALKEEHATEIKSMNASFYAESQELEDEARLESEEMQYQFRRENEAVGMRMIAKTVRRLVQGAHREALAEWRSGVAEQKAQEHAEQIMRRVATRLLHKELSLSIQEWKDNHDSERRGDLQASLDKVELKAAKVQSELDMRSAAAMRATAAHQDKVMRRAACRMRNRDLAMVWGEMRR